MAAERNHTNSAIYEIKIRERLDSKWSEWFYGMTITFENESATILYGPLPDQTVLHSVLDRIRDMNLHLISVNQIVPDGQNIGNEDKGVTYEQ
jgi:hypothetical protein